MFCPPSAIVDVRTYAIDGPTDVSEAAVARWYTELGTKYPDLLKRYSLLQECWKFYSER